MLFLILLILYIVLYKFIVGDGFLQININLIMSLQIFVFSIKKLNLGSK